MKVCLLETILNKNKQICIKSMEKNARIEKDIPYILK